MSLIFPSGRFQASISPEQRSYHPRTTTTAIGVGDEVSSAIAAPGDQAIFTFSGESGQRLYYDSLNADFPNITATRQERADVKMILCK